MSPFYCSVLLLQIIVAGADPSPEPDDKVAVAKAKREVRKISEAVKTYYAKHNQFPATLSELAEIQPDGTKPLLTKADLIDPWKKPYKYDPEGPRNGGNMVDIWTIGPDKKLIGNWMRDKK